MPWMLKPRLNFGVGDAVEVLEARDVDAAMVVLRRRAVDHLPAGLAGHGAEDQAGTLIHEVAAERARGVAHAVRVLRRTRSSASRRIDSIVDAQITTTLAETWWLCLVVAST